MGWLGVVFSVCAAWLLRDDGWLWFGAAIGVGVLELWSWGIMHNYAVESARSRSDYKGGFYDFTPRDVAAAPNWITVTNMIGFASAAALLAIGFTL